MREVEDSREKLRQRIDDKKDLIRSFLAKAQPRSNRLTIASIVCAGLAGLLTAGPAAGGPSFTQILTETLGTTSPSWRILCAVATLLSFIATTTLTIQKTQDLGSRIAKAQAAHGRLEAIETLLDTTDISNTEIANQYAAIIRELPFVSSE